jgi:hypothetical protein
MLGGVVIACGDATGPASSAPVIRFVDPPAVLAGDPIEIRGSGFGENPSRVQLTIAGAPLTLDRVSDTLLVATLPDSLRPGRISVAVQVSAAPVVATGSVEIVLPPAPPFVRAVLPDSVLGRDTLIISGRYLSPLFPPTGEGTGLLVGGRAGALLGVTDSLLIALAPRTVGGRFPVVYRRDFASTATSRDTLTIVPPVAGTYLVLSALAAPDSCGRGVELQRQVEGSQFVVEQQFDTLVVRFLDQVYDGRLAGLNFEDRGERRDGRVDTLLLSFTFSSGGGGAIGALEVRYSRGDPCNFRLAMNSRREVPDSIGGETQASVFQIAPRRQTSRLARRPMFMDPRVKAWMPDRMKSWGL